MIIVKGEMALGLSRFNEGEPEKTIRHISHSIDITLIPNKKEINYLKRLNIHYTKFLGSNAFRLVLFLEDKGSRID